MEKLKVKVSWPQKLLPTVVKVALCHFFKGLYSNNGPFHTQIESNTTAIKARLCPAFVFSHWTKQRWYEDAAVCHFIQRAAVAEPKVLRDSTHYNVGICVLFSCIRWLFMSYGCCYNVLWLRSWPTMLHGKFPGLSNITVTSMKTLSGAHLWRGVLFSRGKFTEDSVRRADHRSDLSCLNLFFELQQHNSRRWRRNSELLLKITSHNHHQSTMKLPGSSCQRPTLFFGQKCW